MSDMQGPISDLSSLSPFIFLIIIKESHSISTIGRVTNKPSSTSCKHTIISTAKEYVLVKPSTMFPQQWYCFSSYVFHQVFECKN
ncbi:hypothetical protein ES332_A09G001300v1 [Gossypium tomentosum]|uniref:Uncharacterized protein n=1 Tax=Gossypium tomentosum TaxID=34277 RepID=A0A5D2NY98_GOSTO|nr:hypothetical protein ES332_A09G001300v1 [Gossypium tomentosum]